MHNTYICTANLLCIENNRLEKLILLNAFIYSKRRFLSLSLTGTYFSLSDPLIETERLS